MSLSASLAASQSGLIASTKAFANTAHNIANILTQDAHPLKTYMRSTHGNGVEAITISSKDSTLDLTAEITNTIIEQNFFESSLTAHKTTAQMMKKSLDILA